MMECVDSRAGAVGSEVKAYFRKHMSALEEKERQLCKQVSDLYPSSVI